MEWLKLQPESRYASVSGTSRVAPGVVSGNASSGSPTTGAMRLDGRPGRGAAASGEGGGVSLSLWFSPYESSKSRQLRAAVQPRERTTTIVPG